MDNFDSFIFDGLLDRYIEEQAKFEKGQVVYMEYTYQYHNQTKLGVCVGIVTEVGITKVERTVGNNKYIDYRNARPKYLEAFWALVNWEFASANYDA